MTYKKIALYFLFFSSQLFSMLVTPIKTIQRPKQRQNSKKFSYEQLSKDMQRNYQCDSPLFAQRLVFDVLPNIMKHLDIKSTLDFLATCKDLQAYKDKGFVLNPETYMQEMIRLCQAGDKEQVGKLMRRGAPVHEKQIKSILRCFNTNDSDFDNLDVIMRIYGKKYDPECEDFTQLKTEFDFEALARNPLLCQLSLEQGLSPNIYGIDEMYGSDPLIMTVIRRGNLEVLKLLIGHAKINPNKENKDGESPLKVAIEGCNSEVLKLLLDHREIEPNKEIRYAATPLIYAISLNNSEAIELLLKNGKIEPNKEYNGETPLIKAINKGDSKAIKHLLKNGKIDLDKENREGEVPLLCAAINQSSNVEILGMLLAHNKIKRKNLFWYNLYLIKLYTTYKARLLYWCRYIAGYVRKTIDTKAAIYNDAYLGDTALNMGFLSIFLSLAYLSHG